MKTFTLLIAMIAGALASLGQVLAPMSNSTRESRFSTDQVIHSKPAEDQRNLRIASAFNGWLYAAYTINNATSGIGGVYVSVSKDNGASWKTFITYQFSNSIYSMTDITLGGKDSLHICVFVGGVLQNTTNGTSTIYVDNFDGRTGNLNAGQVFHRSLGTMSVTGLALASDYLFPANGAAPFGVGLLYSLHGGTKDSLLFAGSNNGGQSFSVNTRIASTSYSYRKVALAFGSSPSISGGSYFAAWELLATNTAMLGHIYTSHSSISTSYWAHPICLDSLSPLSLNVARNPAISVQLSNTDNDLGDLSAVVAFESPGGGNMQDMNVLSAMSKRAFSDIGWLSFPIASTSKNELQPAVSFNSWTNKFETTYLDSTDGQLPFAEKDLNLGTQSPWSFLTAQFNDQTTAVGSAQPRIVVSPLLRQAGFVWLTTNPGTGHGVAMFDGEYAGIATGISSTNQTVSNTVGNAFPNPANAMIRIPVSTEIAQPLLLEVYDLLGNSIRANELIGLSAGNQMIQLDVADLADGVYFCHIETGSVVKTIRFIVRH
jgi:hypothetical protein